MTRALYSLLMWLGQPLLRRKLMRRGKLEAGYHQHVEERFGRYDAETIVAAGDFVWVHAVSLGETRAAELLIGRLRERLPGLRLGGLRIGNLSCVFADLHTFKIWDLVDRPAILIGMDVMRHFKTIELDFGRREVVFETGPKAAPSVVGLPGSAPPS